MRTRIALAAGLFLLGLLPLVALDAGQWTLEEVLGRLEEANGGLKTIESTTNFRVQGEVRNGETVYDFLLLKKRPDKVRIHLMHQGRSIETGFNGQRGWRRIWVQGRDRVAELTDFELASANLDIDFDGPLIGPVLPGTKRELLGVERIDRVDYFVILVEDPQARSRHYIDARTFREWKTVREILKDGEVATTVETVYSRYRRHKTIWLAEQVERIFQDGSSELILVKQAEIDPGLLDRVFEMPEQWAEQ